MKRRAKWGSPALVVVIGMVFSVGCSQPKPPVFKGVNQFKVEDIGQDSATLFAQLLFSNPNDKSLDFKKLDCQIFANNNLVGHYQQDTVTHILPNADFAYPARLRIDMHPIVQNAVSVFLSGVVDLHFVGTVKVGRGGFFMNVPIDFSHKQKLQF
ncbi:MULTISPECIES: hypothetical protein [Chitinophagaceae]